MWLLRRPAQVLVLLLSQLTAIVSTAPTLPEIRIAVVKESTPANPGIAFAALSYFEKHFQVENRTILPNHHVIFDRYEHGHFPGDASEKVGEVIVPWGTKHAAVVGFHDASVNETIRLLATQRVLQVHQAVGTHLSDRTKFPYSFRARISAEGQIIARYYILASLRWMVSASVWATAGEVDTAIAVADRYGIMDYTRLYYPGGENLLFTDFQDRILGNRMRTILSGAPLQVTIDLVCYLHRDGRRGFQYFFPQYFTFGWWGRQEAGYPCTADDLYIAAYGHVVLSHTPIAPGTDLGSFRIPPLEPFGETQNVPLTCTPGLTSDTFWNSVEFIMGLLYGYGEISLEEATGYWLDQGAEYALYCSTLLALHNFLYAKGASLLALEERDESSFLQLVDSIQNVEFMGPGGRFQYMNGTGDPAPIFEIVMQFALDGLGNSSVDVNGAFTFANGFAEDPVAHFEKALLWRDGSTGLSPNPDLSLFPDCSVINAVLVGEFCVKCAPGTVYDLTSSLCTICPLGSFQNQSGRSACDVSPAGYFIEDVALPRSIAPCPMGYSCPQSGTISPTPCAQGQFASEHGSISCALCVTGQYQPDLGAYSCNTCADRIKESTTAFRGSIDAAECICPEGMYLPISDNSTCRPCPAGMHCPLGSDMLNIPRLDALDAADGAAYPKAMPGFMTLIEDPLHPYECLDDGACPGGAPGVCGFRRAVDTIACGECDEFSFEAAHKCKECGSASWLPFFVAAVLALGVLTVTSVVTNYSVQSTPGAAMTVSAVVGVFVTSVQTLSVLNKMGAAWGEPLETIMSMAGLVRLKSDVLKVGCVTGNGPAITYLYGQLVAPLSIPLVGMILCMMKYIFPIRSLAHVPLHVQLTNTVGTIASALFITIVLQCVEPFVCYRHLERDDWSLVSSPSILCYRFDSQGYVSIAMIGVVVFLLLPMPFVVTCAVFIRRYPKIVLSNENQNFLHASRFLFYRFTPPRYYFNFIILLRNLVLGLIPAVLSGRPGLEGLAIATLLCIYCGVHQELRAWRSDVLNLVDAMVCFLLVLVVLCAGLLITDSVERDLIQAFAGTFTILLFLTLIAALCRGLRERLLPRKFTHFICHHKAEAAAQARFLKIVLQQERYSRIFIDSDDLCDLDGLFDIVKSRVKHLVVYLTSETLRRPWCAGEIATATQAKIRITPVRTRCYSPPLAREIQDVQCYLDVFSCNLTEYNIQYADVSAAYKSLVGLEGTYLDASIPGSERFHTVARFLNQAAVMHRGSDLVSQVAQALPGSPRVIGGGRRQQTSHATLSSSGNITSNSPNSPSGVVISTLPDNDEAIAVGGILKAELIEKVFRAYNCVVNLMCDLDADEGELTVNAHSVLVVLSDGSLRSLVQLNVMLLASFTHSVLHNPLCVIPITTPGFQFPGQDFYEDLTTENGRLAELAHQHGGLAKAAELFRGFFRVVSIFLPTSGSQQVLETQGEAIMDRLRLHTKTEQKTQKRSLKRHGSSHSLGSDPSCQTDENSGITKGFSRPPMEEKKTGNSSNNLSSQPTETVLWSTSHSMMSQGPSETWPSFDLRRMGSSPTVNSETIRWQEEC